MATDVCSKVEARILLHANCAASHPHASGGKRVARSCFGGVANVCVWYVGLRAEGEEGNTMLLPSAHLSVESGANRAPERLYLPPRRRPAAQLNVSFDASARGSQRGGLPGARRNDRLTNSTTLHSFRRARQSTVSSRRCQTRRSGASHQKTDVLKPPRPRLRRWRGVREQATDRPTRLIPSPKREIEMCVMHL